MYPADERLVDDVGGNDKEFGMLSSGRDNGGDGGIFDIDLATHVSSASPNTMQFWVEFIQYRHPS